MRLGDLVPYIDWSPFFMAWELRGRYPRILKDEVVGGEATKLFNDAQKMLQAELDSKFGKDWFTVSNVNLRNLTVDKKLEQAIRDAAQVQYQIDAKAKQVVLAQEEAKRLTAEAQGRADAARIEALALQGAAGAEYLKKMELENAREAIRKWDGVMPTTNGTAVLPFVNVK